LSDAATSYQLEQLEPSDPPPRDLPARLLVQARAEAEEIREQARRQGSEEGRAEGHAQARVEVQACVDSLSAAIAGVQEVREQIAETVEAEAIELALALAAKIVGGALQARPQLVVRVLAGALRRVSGQRGITVLLNPADYEHVRASLEILQAQAGAIELSDLQPDQRIAAGGVVVRTGEGEVDARVETQLERAGEAIALELSGGSAA
jgi:flagellar assembly protein FliH